MIKGQYRPGLKIDSIRIPSTVQTVLADRIDRLPTLEKHLLQTASAIGVIVPMALLRAVAGLPEDELYRHLAHAPLIGISLRIESFSRSRIHV